MQATVGAGTSITIFCKGWLPWYDYSGILSDIIANAGGGGSLVGFNGPTLQLRGHSKLEIANPTAADLFAEIVEFSVNESYPFSLSAISSAYSAAWGYSFGSRQSGFEFFPTTSVKQNWVFWTQKYSGVVKRRSRSVRIKPSQVRRLLFSSSAVVGYADGKLAISQSASTAFRSTFFCIRLRFATGIVCGSTTWPGPNPPAPAGGVLPLIAPVGGDIAIKVTRYYKYRWVPGAVVSTQKGSWLAQSALINNYPATEQIAQTASGWAPDPSQRRMALTGTANVAAAGTVNDFTDWGPFFHGPPGFTYPYNPSTSRAVGLAGNVPSDCAGDAWNTTVHTG